jgi:hypothetical protein
MLEPGYAAPPVAVIGLADRRHRLKSSRIGRPMTRNLFTRPVLARILGRLPSGAAMAPPQEPYLLADLDFGCGLLRQLRGPVPALRLIMACEGFGC